MKKINIYDTLIKDVNDIVSKAEKLEVAHDNIKPIKDALISDLNDHRDIFEKSATKAKALSEWDKYTIAFFGETNAGKSTIIETLRIIGNEKGKIDEYEVIERIINDIDNKEKDIARLKQTIESLETRKLLLTDKLKEQEGEKNNLLNTKEKITLQLACSNENILPLERKIYELKEKISTYEIDVNHQNYQKKTLIKRIQKEEDYLEKKEKSTLFRLRFWVARLFGKEILINKELLLNLKKDEIALIQTISELDENLQSVRDIKNKADAEITKCNEKAKEYNNRLNSLLIDITDINDVINNLSLETNENVSSIDRVNNNIIRYEDVLSQQKHKLKDLGDGQIIGTGKQDFTVDVNSYELEYNNQSVVLIDVPGIEGDEERYSSMIKDAVSKAHAIFYVNGSNKKPEEKTISKIQTYLQDQTEVYSISNVKGKADSYEFEEDRLSLIKTPKDLNNTAALTEKTLNDILGDKYKGHFNIQGLMAFIASSKYIIPKRADLVRSNKNFSKYFQDKDVMKRFSNISTIESHIIEQQPFCKYKIKAANYQTIIGVANRFTHKLEEFQKSTISDYSIAQIKREINNYKREVKGELVTVKSKMINISNKGTDRFYYGLQEFFYLVIDKKFEEAFNLFPRSHSTDNPLAFLKPREIKEDKLKEFVDLYVTQLVESVNDDFKRKIEDALKTFDDTLQNKKKRISSRLKVLDSNVEVQGANVDSIDMSFLIGEISFGDVLKEGATFAGTVGGMALTGAGIGGLPGAIIGAIFGLVLYGIKKIFGGESKEAKMKREIEPSLRNAKEQIRSMLDSTQKQTYENISEGVSKESKVLDCCVDGLDDIQKVLIEKTKDIDLLSKNINKERIEIERNYTKINLN